jgi:hypothetical protein
MPTNTCALPLTHPYTITPHHHGATMPPLDSADRAPQAHTFWNGTVLGTLLFTHILASSVLVLVSTSTKDTHTDIMRVLWTVYAVASCSAWYTTSVTAFARLVVTDTLDGHDVPASGANYPAIALSLLLGTAVATAAAWTAFFAFDFTEAGFAAGTNGAAYFDSVPDGVNVAEFWLHCVIEALSVTLTPGTVQLTPSTLGTKLVYIVHAVITIFFTVGFLVQWAFARNVQALAAERLLVSATSKAEHVHRKARTLRKKSSATRSRSVSPTFPPAPPPSPSRDTQVGPSLPPLRKRIVVGNRASSDEESLEAAMAMTSKYGRYNVAGRPPMVPLPLSPITDIPRPDRRHVRIVEVTPPSPPLSRLVLDEGDRLQ